MTESVRASAGAHDLRVVDDPALGNGKVPAAPSALLRAQGVTKRWQRGRLTVLEGVDVAIEPGTLVSIVGANGAGKTTLLRILAGLIVPDAGTVRLEGLDPRKDRREYQRRIGLLSAGYGGLYARLTVRQQLDFSARMALIPAARRVFACDEALARFGLSGMGKRRLDRLSMGQRQRVRLALTFLHHPDFALLDEPWNSLDEEGERLLAATLIELRSHGRSAICCTPSGSELGRHCKPDRVLQLEGGKLRAA